MSHVIRARCGKGTGDPVYVVHDAKDVWHARLAAFFQTFGADRVPTRKQLTDMTEVISFSGTPVDAKVYRTPTELGVDCGCPQGTARTGPL